MSLRKWVKKNAIGLSLATLLAAGAAETYLVTHEPQIENTTTVLTKDTTKNLSRDILGCVAFNVGSLAFGALIYSVGEKCSPYVLKKVSEINLYLHEKYH